MFTFKNFSVDDSLTAMKVGTDGVLLGAWAEGGKRILDIGTGSGLIVLMMAQRFPNAGIVGIDIDADACRQAELNAAHSPYQGRIEIINQSLQEFTNAYDGEPFDAIVSNPPFFRNSLTSPDSKRTLARHNNSLSFRELATCSKSLLTESGTLSVIGPADAEEDISAEMIISGLSANKLVLLKTKSNKKAIRFMCQYVNGIPSTYDKSTEVLNNDDGTRTEWYHSLTKDFYIK